MKISKHGILLFLCCILWNIDATMNLGMRLELSGHFVFISSIGTGIASPSSDAMPLFISFVGLQLNI